MRNEIVLRKDTFSLIKQFILVEFISTIFYFIIDFLLVINSIDYKSPIDYLINIDSVTLFIFIILSIVIMFLFIIHWYLKSTIHVSPKLLIFRKGLFLKKISS